MSENTGHNQESVSDLVFLMKAQQERLDSVVDKASGTVKWWHLLGGFGILITAIFTVLNFIVNAENTRWEQHMGQPHSGVVREVQYAQDKQELRDEMNRRFDSLERQIQGIKE